MNDDDTTATGQRIAAISATVHAPAALRLAFENSPAPRRRTAARRPFVIAGVAAAGALILVALSSGGGGPGQPTVADAAVAALRAPTHSAPRGADGALSVSSGGVRFPDYAPAARWRPRGTRTDRVGGRTTVSVVYDGGGVRAGYAIVPGPPLPIPAGARRLHYAGVTVAVLRRGGIQIVTWRRGGRTCVVAARGTSLDRLLDLVAQT